MFRAAFLLACLTNMQICGIPDPDGNKISLENGFLPIDPSLKYMNYGISYFTWGCCSGTAQLAFALLLHFCGAENAYLYHLAFKSDVLVHTECEDPLILYSEDIQTYIAFKKAQNTKFGKLYWKLFGKLHFKEYFYDEYIYPLQSKKRESADVLDEQLYSKPNYINLLARP